MSHRIWTLIVVVVIIFGQSPDGGVMSSSRAAVIINTTEHFQVIEGFGASGAWWAQDVGGWEDQNRRQIIELLFDQHTGIGLSLYRYNIGGGSKEDILDPWRGAETFEVEPGAYDWSRDANAIWVLKAAHAAGVEQFVAFANTPPARMTVSGKANGHKEGDSNLREDMVDDFARYLVDVTRHLREVEGIPIGWISPINEPQWDWQPSKGQEGCHYTTGEILAVTRALLKAIDEAGLEVKVSAPEAAQWKYAQVYVQTLFDDDAFVAAQLDHFAVHSYWSDLRDKLRLVQYVNREHPEVKLWMTEWTEMVQGRDYGMDSALVMANVIHDDLVLAGVTSWQYWIAVSKYNFRDGLIYTDEYKQNIRETKRLWAMGNFSRFVRPGYVRIGATSDQGDLRISAYSAPDGESLVMVAINVSDKAISAAPEIIAEQPFGRIEIYETSKANDLAQIFSGEVPIEIVFAPQSVTTAVLR